MWRHDFSSNKRQSHEINGHGASSASSAEFEFAGNSGDKMTNLKGHRKSRNGCKTCKERKVKCDELKPKCSNCEVRDEVCIYLKPDKITRHRLKKRTAYRSVGMETTSYSTEESSTSGSQDPPTVDSATSVESVTTTKSYVPYQLNSQASVISHSAFVEVTKLNNKILKYYQDTFFKLLSSNAKFQSIWRDGLFLIGSADYLFHIAASTLFLHFYHNCISSKSKTEPYLNLSGADQYLFYSKTNQQSYASLVALKDGGLPDFGVPSTLKELYTNTLSNVFYTLNMFLSPYESVLDPSFWKCAKLTQRLILESKAEQYEEASKKIDLVFYVNPQHGDKSSETFQPLYLKGLADFVDTDFDKKLISGTAEIISKEFLKLKLASDPLQVVLFCAMQVDDAFSELVAAESPVAFIIIAHYLLYIFVSEVELIPKSCVIDEFQKIDKVLSCSEVYSPWIDVPRRVIYEQF